MLLEVELKNETTDRMLVFRNEDNFFSCFEESAWENQNGDLVYRFTASEYVSKFNVLNMPEYSDYTFSVTFSYDGEKLSDINFAYSESPYSSKIQSVSIQSYDFANNVSVSNSADKLSEELYKIYLEEIAAGITYPVHPEKPKLPESSEEKDQSEDIGTDIGMLDYLPFAVSELFLLEGEGSFETKTGFMVISNDSDNEIKKLFPNEYFSDLLQKLDNGDNEEKWAIVWVKGRARISDYKAYPRNDKDISLNFEYVLFENSDIFSVFAFEVDEKYGLASVDFNQVSYSTTVRATFTTENKYDYLDGNEREDEYTINLQDNLTYSLYKNDELVYMGEYKVSEGYVVLCTENDVFYNEVSPISTFVYKLDGLNRIFMLK